MTLPDAQHRRAIWLWGSFPRKTQSVGLGADGVAGNAGGGHHQDNSYVALHCGAMKPTRDDREGDFGSCQESWAYDMVALSRAIAFVARTNPARVLPTHATGQPYATVPEAVNWLPAPDRRKSFK